jgi:hypothetical protein
MYEKAIFIQVLCLGIVLCLTGFTTAEYANPSDRSGETQVGTEQFSIVSDSSNCKINDRFGLTFENGTISLYYEQNLNTHSPRWSMELAFNEIVRFLDDGSGSFDANDTIVSTEEIANQTYNMFYIAPVSTSIDRGGVINTYTAIHESGLVTLVFTTTSIWVTDFTYNMMPTDIRLDVIVTNFNRSTDFDAIALKMSLHTDAQTNVSWMMDNGRETGLNISHGAMGGHITWFSAQADGAIYGNPAVNWTGHDLVMAYPSGNVSVLQLQLDVNSLAPFSGVIQIDSGGQGDLPLFVLGLCVSAGVVSSAIYIRKAKNH